MFRSHTRLFILASYTLTWPAVVAAQSAATVEPGLREHSCGEMVAGAIRSSAQLGADRPEPLRRWRCARRAASLESTSMRETIGLSLGEWATSWLSWSGGAAYDRFDGASYVALTGELQARMVRDHVALSL